ncbi:MAG: glycosyltransferase family 2 protein [Colwellia sp.]
MDVPVVFISHNNNGVFKKSIESFFENTTEIYSLHIVDNASTDIDHISYLQALDNKSNVTVWFNKKNLFVLGLNNCLEYLSNSNYPYYAVCDSDFTYPEKIDATCWLSAFVEEMDNSPHIGKLGLSISLDNIKNDEQLASIYKREISFSKFSLTSNIWKASVDTTPAIYRSDFFVWNDFKFFPGHMTAFKPFYYTGRHKFYTGYHMGWDADEYKSNGSSVNREKVISFALYGGAIDSTVLKKVSVVLRIQYFSIKFISSLYWRTFKAFHFFKYLFKNRIFLMNECMYRDLE